MKANASRLRGIKRQQLLESDDRLPCFLCERNVGMIALLLGVVVLIAPVSPVPDDDLRVMVWNVLHGGNDVEQGPEKALKIIRDQQLDVVLLQESYDIDGERPRLGEWLAEQLGWHHHQAESKHLCVLTPLKIEATFFHHMWHGVGAKLTDEGGRSLLAWSTWIDWQAFITYELRDNPDISDEDLLAAECTRSQRVQQTDAILAYLKEIGQLQADIPLVVGGDWNCPSHLDWTADTARVYRDRRDLDLPVSIALRDAGFVDTYRALYPNPVQHPGLTWSPMYRGPRSGKVGAPQSFERIDRLYVKNPAEGWTLRAGSGVVLPKIWEDDSIPLPNRTFPSDHGALVMELQWVEVPKTSE
jgi:exonuclease III